MIKMLIAAALVSAPIVSHAAEKPAEQLPPNVTDRGIMAASCIYVFATGLVTNEPTDSAMTTHILVSGVLSADNIVIGESLGDEKAQDYMIKKGHDIAHLVDLRGDVAETRAVVKACYALVGGE